MEHVILAVKQSGLPTKKRQTLYRKVIHAFEDQDCDTLGECEGIDAAFDKALAAAHPEWAEDEEADG